MDHNEEHYAKQVWITPKLNDFSVVSNTNAKPVNVTEDLYQIGPITFQYQGPPAVS